MLPPTTHDLAFTVPPTFLSVTDRRADGGLAMFSIAHCRAPLAERLRELVGEPALYQVRTPDGAVLCTVVPGPAFGELEALRRRAGAPDLFPRADRQ